MTANIKHALDKCIDQFEMENGKKPTTLYLGRLQIAALNDFRSKYISTLASNKMGPNYEEIPIIEKNEEDLLMAE